MKIFIFVLLAFTFSSYSQNIERVETFKGDHYALYNKCLFPVTFCEITQQTYTSCGSTKNCYGLYVLPGDTFYVNIEDKNQTEIISADVSFGGYFPAMTNVIFKPIDNNCVPEQALQMIIPLTAVPGSSFQIEAQNLSYVTSTVTPNGPLPYNIYIGGQQPQFTFALSDFTNCPVIEEVDSSEVSVKELRNIANSISISPNPANDNLKIWIRDFQKVVEYRLSDIHGSFISRDTLGANINIIQLNEFLPGMYFISFYNEGNLIVTKKIIVSK